MKQSEFKTYLFELFGAPVDGVVYEEKMKLIEKYLVEYQIKHDDEREKPNHGDAWTDDELRIILMNAPTKNNCIRFSQIFGRGYGSIEQIYRWASTDDQTVKETRPADSFVARIKRIAKELGWRA